MRIRFEKQTGHQHLIEDFGSISSFNVDLEKYTFPGNTHLLFIFERDYPDRSVHPLFQLIENQDIGWLILPSASDESTFISIVSTDGKVHRQVRRGQHNVAWVDFRWDTEPSEKTQLVKQIRTGEGFCFRDKTYMVFTVQPAKSGTVCAFELQDGKVVEFDEDAVVTPCEIIMDFSATVSHIGQ